jgi:hypothetical protein
MPAWAWAIAAIVVVVGAVYTVYGAKAADDRRHEMAALAARRGFSFSSGYDYSLASTFPGYVCLHTG